MQNHTSYPELPCLFPTAAHEKAEVFREYTQSQKEERRMAQELEDCQKRKHSCQMIRLVSNWKETPD